MFGFGKKVVAQSLGTDPRVTTPKSAVVVGGGLAGVAAAVVLAERGVTVTLIERERYLGGRVGGWTDQLADGEPFEMERGFHAFFRQYYNLRNLLRRIDPELHHLMPLVDYPILGPDGYHESFRRLPRLPVANVAALTMRTPTLTLRDLRHVNVRAALAMLAYERERTYARYDEMTARNYLDSLNFPTQARRMLFDVFSHSFFNPEEEMSAGEMLMMFHFYFTGNPEGLIFDVLCEPFSDGLWQPFARYLSKLGVSVRTKTEVLRVERSDERWRVVVANDHAPVVGDALVLAPNVPGLKAIVAASPDLTDDGWRKQIDGLSLTLPFAVWRIWLDQEVAAERVGFVGTAGLGTIDNISVYERFEGESRRHVMRTGGSVLEIHAYAVPEGETEESIKRVFLNRLHELYPETRDAVIREERFLLRQDCPAFPPGGYDAQPTVETPWPTLTLAGDFAKLPFPSALMERATASGMMAANHILSTWGVRGEEIYSVPPRGVIARWF